jgi:hypothetical protein
MAQMQRVVSEMLTEMIGKQSVLFAHCQQHALCVMVVM